MVSFYSLTSLHRNVWRQNDGTDQSESSISENGVIILYNAVHYKDEGVWKVKYWFVVCVYVCFQEEMSANTELIQTHKQRIAKAPNLINIELFWKSYQG